jgi:hypothetical protein
VRHPPAARRMEQLLADWLPGPQYSDLGGISTLTRPHCACRGGRSSSMDLLALPAKAADDSSPTAASKLLVGPASLRNSLPGGAWKSFFGRYWVVAVGESPAAAAAAAAAAKTRPLLLVLPLLLPAVGYLTGLLSGDLPSVGGSIYLLCSSSGMQTLPHPLIPPCPHSTDGWAHPLTRSTQTLTLLVVRLLVRGYPRRWAQFGGEW